MKLGTIGSNVSKIVWPILAKSRLFSYVIPAALSLSWIMVNKDGSVATLSLKQRFEQKKMITWS